MRKITAGMFSALLAVAGFAGEMKIQNPSFEQGSGGYWISKPALARIDTETSSQGMQSLCLEVPAGAKVSAVQFIPMLPGEIYRFAFDAKGDGEAKIQVKLMLQGKKPIVFWLPPGKKTEDFEFTPSAAWSRRELVFGPVPEQSMGQQVSRIGIFIDICGGGKPGKVWLDNLVVTTAPADAAKVADPAPAAASPAKTKTETAKPTAGQSSPELFRNGSFEQGVTGYWINLPKAAKVDSKEYNDGKKSLRIEPTDGKKVSVVQGVPFRDGEVYRLSFDVRGDAGSEGPKIQVALLLQGKKAIQFWTPDGKSKFVHEAGLTGKWTRQEVTFGPVPAQALGQDVTGINIFFDVVPGSKPGPVYLDNIRLTTEKADVKKKSGQPLSFELPAPVQIYEHAVPVRVTASSAFADAVIRLKAVDCRGRTVLERTAAASAGLNFVLDRPDYYQLNATLERQGKVVASGKTSLLFTTPLPTDYYSTPEPAFGVWGGLSPEMLRLGGAKWTRELFFTLFQKKDFVAAAPTAEKLQKRSPVKVIKCLNVLNPFKRMVPVPAADWPGIIDKVTKELVSSRGLVDVWETQNEPMVGENFHGAMKDVVDIISRTSALVRENNPGVPLAGICINPMSLNQYGQITGYYRNFNIGRYIDGVMLHPYIPNAAPPDSSGYVETLTRLERDLRDITGKDIPLYISEIGYSTKPGGEVTELQQAAYLARVVLLNRRIKNLRACVWHIGLWNDATSPRELDYGILRGHPKGSLFREPKPAFAAWATVSRQTYDAAYIGDMEFGRGVKVMLFSRRGKPLLVAYSLSGRPQRLKIPLSGAKAAVTDVCGAVAEVPLKSGMIELVVDEAPVYIAGSEADDVRRLSGLKVDFTPEELKARPGDRMTVKISGAPLTRPGSSLRVEVPSGWKAAIDGSGSQRQVSITVPAGTTPGETPLFFHLMENGESRNIWRREFQVMPPVELQNVKLQSAANGGMELAFTPVGQIKNPRLQLKVREDDKVMTSTTIEVNRPALVALPTPAFGRPHQYTAELTMDRDYSWQVSLPALNRFPLARTEASTPLASWPSPATFDLSSGEYSRHAVSGEFDRPEGKLYLGWNRDCLLLRLVCRDRRQITVSQPESMWAADSLQIGFSVPREEMVRPNNDGIQETSFAEFGIMPAADGQCRSLVWSSTNRTLSELGKPLPGVKASWQRDGDTITYRIDLPWQTLNVKNPRAGMPLKFSLLINDCDSVKGKGYQRHWLEWYSGIADGKNPSLYGDGVLE